MEYFLADHAWTHSFCPVRYTVAGCVLALLFFLWIIFHNDTHLQRNLATRYAILRQSHTISKLGLRASKGMEQRRLGSSLKSRMGTRPLKFFWVTTSRVPMLWKGRRLGERKRKRGKNKGKKKKDTCNGFYQKYGKKVGEPKDNKKKWNEATTERKDDMQKRVWTEYQNKTSTVTRKKERKRSENKKKYCSLLKTNTWRLTKWFSVFTVWLARRPACRPAMLTCGQTQTPESRLDMKNHWGFDLLTNAWAGRAAAYFARAASQVRARMMPV